MSWKSCSIQLGYESRPVENPGPGWSSICYAHPAGRKAVFVGDLVDRGPRVIDSLSLVRNMIDAGSALCVPGNHDMKLLRKLRGKDVQITHGLANTLAEIDAIPEEQREQFIKELAPFLDGLVSHYVLDNGRVVVAHAGMKESMQGRGSGKVREFALYGETTGETDEFGLPVRYNWAAEYRGDAMVVYGHTPVPQPDWLNKTINIDTGCVFGGSLTALRYPEQEFVSVKARRDVLRAGPAVPRGRTEIAVALHAARARRPARPRGRDRQADHFHSAAAQRDHPRRERHGRAGGHEPICGQSEMAGVSAADDVAVRDFESRRLFGAS